MFGLTRVGWWPGPLGLMALMTIGSFSMGAWTAPVAGSAATAGHAGPLVKLQQLVGDNQHIHTDEVRYRPDDSLLFYCGYDFGVVDASVPDAMVILAERLRHDIPGDERTPGCIHLAFDGDRVYTTHRGNIDNPAFLSGWTLGAVSGMEGRLAPVQLPVLQEPDVSYEGIDAANGLIYVALRGIGLGIYEFDPADGFRRLGVVSGLPNAWGVRVQDQTAFVSDGLDGLVVIDVADPTRPGVVSRIATGGQARGLALDGDRVYLAAGSEGLVVVDVADRTRPAVLGRADVGPGTAIRLDLADDHAYVAAWTDTRVYDISDPTNLRFAGAVRLTRELPRDILGRPAGTSRTMGVAAAGRTLLIGNWHLLYSYQFTPDVVAPGIILPEAVSLLDFGTVDHGDQRTIALTVGNQGTAPLKVHSIRAGHPDFTVAPDRLNIQPGAVVPVEIQYKASSSEPVSGLIEFHSDDPLEPVRQGFIMANSPGLSVGDPVPEFRVNLVDGGQWSSADATGQVMLLAYFSTFCPVCSIELPEIEDRFWSRFRDRGLVVVGVNPGGRGALRGLDPTDHIGGVAEYAARMGVSYPVGLEQSANYASFAENFRGANPFPMNIVVDRAGTIRYIAGEYDPVALTNLIEDLLGQ